LSRAAPDVEDAGVKSALRALEILELLTSVERPLSFAEIGERLGYPRSSLHGLMRTLLQRGWVELDGARAYTLGIRAWEAGQSYHRALSLAERGRQYMERVRDQLNETVQMAVLDGRRHVYIAKVDGAQRLVLQSEVGRRLEAHATALGKALLAHVDEAELDRLLDGVALERFTPATISDTAALRAELERIRARGYATDDEEYTPGVRCVAAPVRSHDGRVVAAMSVSVPTVRFRAQIGARARALITAAAADLSAALGYRPERPSR
jgi:DNA-binding IclR family transcriptional regulator